MYLQSVGITDFAGASYIMLLWGDGQALVANPLATVKKTRISSSYPHKLLR
jgi:hypothetical protein